LTRVTLNPLHQLTEATKKTAITKLESRYGQLWFVFIGLYVHRNPAEAIRNPIADPPATLSSFAPIFLDLKEMNEVAGLHTGRDWGTGLPNHNYNATKTTERVRNPTSSYPEKDPRCSKNSVAPTVR
jgi:hypothetical protein